MESSLCVSIETLFQQTSLLHSRNIQRFPSLRFEEMGIFRFSTYQYFVCHTHTPALSHLVNVALYSIGS